jgi:broad specificity phosphatase PhoE
MIYLLRHAHAGNKQTWSGPDDRRPLSATGRREAAGLVRLLHDRPITTILSSPALRCEQTVQADRQGALPVGLDGRLHVDAGTEDAATLIGPDLDDVVLCTHGELIGHLLGLLRERGAPIGRQAQWPKGSTWLLRLTGDRVAEATYLPPWGRTSVSLTAPPLTSSRRSRRRPSSRRRSWLTTTRVPS